MLFEPYDIDFGTQVKLDACLATLKTLRCADSIRVWKTWINGWATSYRLRSTNLYPCLLGCDGAPDDLTHYVRCSHLYALCKYLISHTSADPLTRLGLVNPCTESFKVICCVFGGYHAAHRLAVGGRIGPISSESLTGCQMRRLWSVFADAFNAEARELSLQHRKFSLPQFIEFIINNENQTDLPDRQMSIVRRSEIELFFSRPDLPLPCG